MVQTSNLAYYNVLSLPVELCCGGQSSLFSTPFHSYRFENINAKVLHFFLQMQSPILITHNHSYTP